MLLSQIAVTLAVPAALVATAWGGFRLLRWVRGNRQRAGELAAQGVLHNAVGVSTPPPEGVWESFRTKLGDWVDSVAESGGSAGGGGSAPGDSMDFGGGDGGGGDGGD